MRSDVRLLIGSGSGLPAVRIDRFSKISVIDSLLFAVGLDAFAQALTMFCTLEDLVDRRPAQVPVDQQHAAPVRLAEREREDRFMLQALALAAERALATITNLDAGAVSRMEYDAALPRNGGKPLDGQGAACRANKEVGACVFPITEPR